MKLTLISACVLSLLLGVSAFAWSEEPEKVSVCQLKSNPPAYNHKLIEVTGFVSQGFEDFALFDPTCPAWPEVWLEYGGKSQSGTMYCCGVSGSRERPDELVVEEVPIPLVKDDAFSKFDKLIHRPRMDSVVHVTLLGRFFAGKQESLGKGGPSWRGYGHMGCCSLFAIQQVNSVNPQDRDDLDYDRYAEPPDDSKPGCSLQSLLPIDPMSEILAAQAEADGGKRGWAYDDPYRVAVGALSESAKIERPKLAKLRETRRTQGRIVYLWKDAATRETYVVAVSRPSWLSYYSKDLKRVAWVALAVDKVSCGGDS